MTKVDGNTRPPNDSDIAKARREQIVEAAVEIITSQGLHNLSLSKIEAKVEMKRGHLTYYFPTKEDILLAVFDRLLLLIIRHISDQEDPTVRHGIPQLWETIQRALQTVLGPEPVGKEFTALQYTFLAQIAHRDDFREKLASQYREWRESLGAHWAVAVAPGATMVSGLNGKTIASFFQALIHGLTMQLAADPQAFDRAEMMQLCITVLAPMFTNQQSRLESAI